MAGSTSAFAGYHDEPDPRAHRPWPALWALVVGFFMILVDSTIVSVATPRLMTALDADVGAVVWVTSAYLLAFAVPLLVTGRLGDRVGPKNVYLAGLALFTVASAWCGLSGTVEMLVVARVAQGLGASLMTPQTMSVITRLFPPAERGTAMGVWGSVAGVAALVGPILGGLLVEVGWSWIFFVNVPVGLLGFALVWRTVPRLRTHAHSFDWAGVALSGIGLFLVVFAVQEGQSHSWGALWGPIGVWHVVIAGLVVLAGFVVWQSRNQREPLVPLRLFRDRNFSLATAAIATVGFAITAMTFPLMLYVQSVRGLSAIQAALLLVPMAVLAAALAPLVGRHLRRVDPRRYAVAGMALFVVALVMYWRLMTPDVPLAWLLVPATVLGLSNAFMWGPLAVTATRNLPAALAGAGSGVYNSTRQVGAVLGSAAIAAAMENRLVVHLGAVGGPGGPESFGGTLPEQLHAGFSAAMGESLLVPGLVLALGTLAALGFAPQLGSAASGSAATSETAPTGPATR